MRVVVHPRRTAETRQGGDWRQLRETIRLLGDHRIEARISTKTDEDLSGTDVCLIWNSVSPDAALAYYRNARAQGTPVALMPFYWKLERFWETFGSWPSRRTRKINALGSGANRSEYFRNQAALVQGADLLFANSQAEADLLAEEYSIDRQSIRVVWNGVSADMALGNATRFRSTWRAVIGDREFLACIARVAPRKNQLGLLLALRHDSRVLVLVGAGASDPYATECRRVSSMRRDVIFVGQQGHDAVADVLAAARAHVLVSRYDVAPLVTLEAAIAGLPQVAPVESGARDYLGDSAWYADPDDHDGIRRAIDAAWSSPKQVDLARRARTEFTWQRTARALAEALWAIA